MKEKQMNKKEIDNNEDGRREERIKKEEGRETMIRGRKGTVDEKEEENNV